MSPINFCKHTRNQFKRALKRAQREIITERQKKEKDEVERMKRLAVGNEGYGSPTP